MLLKNVLEYPGRLDEQIYIIYVAFHGEGIFAVPKLLYIYIINQETGFSLINDV